MPDAPQGVKPILKPTLPFGIAPTVIAKVFSYEVCGVRVIVIGAFAAHANPGLKRRAPLDFHSLGQLQLMTWNDCVVAETFVT